MSSPSADADSDDETDSKDGIGNRPSNYLRKRCPLCFGGENWYKDEEV